MLQLGGQEAQPGIILSTRARLRNQQAEMANESTVPGPHGIARGTEELTLPGAGALTVGRRDLALLTGVVDERLSRQHVKLERCDDGYRVHVNGQTCSVAGRRLARGDSALLRPGETLHLLQIGSERLHPFELRGQTLVWCDQQTSGSKRAEPPAATPPGKRLATAPGSSSSRHPPEAAAATGVPSSAAGSAAGSERLVIDLTEDEDAQLSAHLDGFLGESTSDQMHVKVEGAARAPSTPVKVETAVKLEAAAADPAAAPAAPAGGAEQERALAAWLAAGHDLLHAERMRLAGVLRRSAPSGHAVTELWENPDSVPGRPLYERFVDAWRRASDRRVRIVFHGTPEVPHAFYFSFQAWPDV